MMKYVVMCLCLVAVGSFVPAYAASGVLDDLAIEASGTLDVYSQYLWRGFVLDADPVVQPGIAISSQGITLSLWSSFDIGNDDALNSDEIDYAIDYTKTLGAYAVSVGHTYYEFPGTDGYSKEWYLGVRSETIPMTTLPIAVGLIYYHDYGDESQGGGKGDYVVLEASYSHSLLSEQGITLDCSGHIGYNDGLFMNGQGGDILLSAAVTIPLTERTALSPGIHYSIPYGDLESGDDGNQKKRFFYGVGIAYTF